jgi:hypothetical protein
VAQPDALESRQMLTASGYSFAPPDLSNLLHGPNPTPAVFNRLVGSLQAQVVVGPLADLHDAKQKPNPVPSKIDGNQFVTAVADMVQGFEAAAATALPKNAQFQRLIQLQGDALQAETVSINTQRQVGLLSANPNDNSRNPVGAPSDFFTANQTVVQQLTLSRPLWPYGTPFLNYLNRTENFESDLATLTSRLNATMSPIGIEAADRVAHAEAGAFLGDIHLATTQQQVLPQFLDQQVATLLTQVDAAAQSGSQGVPAFTAAVDTFINATYNTQTGEGYLGPQGSYGRHYSQPTLGALPYSTTNTFAQGHYRTIELAKTTVYHRNFDQSEFGKYVSTDQYPNSAVVIRKSALDQTFTPPNRAFYLADVSVTATPRAKVEVYVGKVAPIYQGIIRPRNTLYPGLGSQIVLPFRTDIIHYLNLRTTGT